MSSGYFITFEGLDGSGKSTQLRHLAAWLEKHGETVIQTRQPGGTAAGDRIRSLILDSRTTGIAPRAELALMFADRAQSIAEIIQPALDAGRIVLCDRYTDSTEAYQGGGRRLGREIVLDLHQAICQGLQPDLTLLLLPSLDKSLARARRRNARTEATDENRFEREQDDFFTRAYDQYRAIASREPHRVTTIDGDGSINAVHQRIVTIVSERLAQRK